MEDTQSKEFGKRLTLLLKDNSGNLSNLKDGSDISPNEISRQSSQTTTGTVSPDLSEEKNIGIKDKAKVKFGIAKGFKELSRNSKSLKRSKSTSTTSRIEPDRKVPEEDESEFKVVAAASKPKKEKGFIVEDQADDSAYEVSRNFIDNVCDGVYSYLVADDVNSANLDHAIESRENLHHVASTTTDISEVSHVFGGAKPLISLNDYIFRMVKYLDRWFHDSPGIKSVGMQSLLCALIYIQRIKTSVRGFQVTKDNVHRLFMVTMLVSAKFMQDKPITNRYWSRVSGVSIPTLNKFETLFCQYTAFDLFVNDDELELLYEEYL